MTPNRIKQNLDQIIEGNVLWYDSKKGHGIITDTDRNEYYFDDSTILSFEEKIKANEFVIFKPTRVSNVLSSGETLLLDIKTYLCYKLIALKTEAYLSYHGESDDYFRDILNQLWEFIEEERANLIKEFGLKNAKERYEKERGEKVTYDKFFQQFLVFEGNRDLFGFKNLMGNITSYIDGNYHKDDSNKFLRFLGMML